MALVLADRVQDVTTTTGTGTITLANTPPTGFQSFAVIGNGNTTYYTIYGGNDWEVGIGTYTSVGTSLSRDTVLASTNSNNLVNFGAGEKVVFVTYPAEKSVNKDASGNVNISITGNAATATVATNLYDGTAGAIPYQTAANTTAFLSSASGVLVGGNPPTFSTTPTLTGTNFTGIPNGALTNSSITLGTTAVSLGATSLTLAGLTSVTLTQDPTLALQAATKQYVDSLAAEGVSYHSPVKYEAPNALTATYNNGTAGVGATLTNSGTLAAFTPDGVVAQVGDRVLIYQQANAAHNGVYTVTTVGSGSVAWVLTRATDANSYGVKDPNKLGAGDAFFVTSGDTGAGETYVMNTTGTITFGTTAINFVQVSAAQVYSAGTGLTLTGTQFSLTSPVATSLGGTGLTTFGAGNRAIYSTSSSALTAGTLPTAAGGTGQTTYTDGQILIGKTSDGSLAKATITAGTGISISNGDGSITVTNSAPDQTVSITGSGTTTVTGTYPSFNVSSADQYVGTVTSVSGAGTVNGLTLTGTVTSTGSLTLGGTLSVDLTTNVTGTLPVANGGTGVTSSTGSGSVVLSTSPTFTTSLTSPIVIGGTAVSSTLILRSTSGAGTSDAIIFQTASQAEAGRFTTKSFFEATFSDKVTALGNTGTAATIDLTLGNVFTATLTGNCTFTLSNPNANSNRGSSFTLILTNDGTAGRTVAWSGGTFRFPGGTVTRTTTANAVDVWFFFTPNNGTTWYGSIPMANMS
jgi:hypothetical protein